MTAKELQNRLKQDIDERINNVERFIKLQKKDFDKELKNNSYFWATETLNNLKENILYIKALEYLKSEVLNYVLEEKKNARKTN